MTIPANLTWQARVLADSVSPDGIRLATGILTYPRPIHSELLTHRMFSRNSASSRAIPLKTMIRNVKDYPFIPLHWGKNQKGMQAERELEPAEIAAAQRAWLEARDNAVKTVEELDGIGLHKQIGNRLLEPWMWITVIVSSTSWKHFFNLRCHKDAEPHFQHIARMWRSALNASTPKPLNYGEWHTPLIGFEGDEELSVADRVRVSVGRCARVSYLTHEGLRDVAADIELAGKLARNGHFSPYEHAATPVPGKLMIGNFRGWRQARYDLPNQFVEDEVWYEGQQYVDVA